MGMQGKSAKKEKLSSICFLVLVVNMVISVLLPIQKPVTTLITVMVSLILYTSLLLTCRREQIIPARVYVVYALFVLSSMCQLFREGELLRVITCCELFIYLAMLRQVKTGILQKRDIILVVLSVASTGFKFISKYPYFLSCILILQVCLLLVTLNPVFYKLAVQHRAGKRANAYHKVSVIKKILFGRNGKWELPDMMAGFLRKEDGD